MVLHISVFVGTHSFSHECTEFYASGPWSELSCVFRAAWVSQNTHVAGPNCHLAVKKLASAGRSQSESVISDILYLQDVSLWSMIFQQCVSPVRCLRINLLFLGETS